MNTTVYLEIWSKTWWSETCWPLCQPTEIFLSCLTRFHLFSDVKIEGFGPVNTDNACQGESLRISCKDPLKSLIIFEAKYGDTGDPTICPYKQFIAQVDSKSPDTLPCSENVTKEIERLCGWENTCEVKAESSLSRVCRGPNNHLSVVYSCGETFIFWAALIKTKNWCLAPLNGSLTCRAGYGCVFVLMCIRPHKKKCMSSRRLQNLLTST